MKIVNSSRFVVSFALFVFFTVTLAAQSDNGIAWKQMRDVSIPLPPGEHPRLYINDEDVASMATRLKDPALQSVVKRLQEQSQQTMQFSIEWNAVQYLISKDRALGRTTIDSALALLKRTELPDKHDAARETGRMMVTGAIVYDWMYDLITPSEKEEFIEQLIRLAKTLECDYPPTRQGSVTGHSSESFIMRDMLSAGVAIYNEFPEMYELAAERFFREHLPARNWLYNGHAYHQGDSYGPLRYSWDTYPLMIFGKMGINNVYNKEQRYVPYFYTYVTRPDGQRMRAGDTYQHSAPKGRPWNPYPGTLFTASYYGDGIILDYFLRQGGTDNNENIFQLLWWDTNLQRKSITTLPLSRYFGGPFGWMVARTGWDDNSVIAEMKVNEYLFNNHQHMDGGAFQIYYKGPLATESGIYQGTSGGYGSAHDKNYQWRTISHNTLLIYNPLEKFSTRGDYGNDGGQRLPNNRGEPSNLNALLDPAKGYKTGDVLAQGFGPDVRTPDYTYLKGDITKAYSDKVKEVKRSFVFLNLKDDKARASLIVFDKVVSSNPEFKKFWLMHSIEQPVINGNEFTVTNTQDDNNGKLVNTTLLPGPKDLEINAIGGPGKEHWVFGTNYPSESKYTRTNSYERAAWRVEVTPKKASAENYFLNVMQIMDTNGQSVKVQRIDGDDLVGIRIADRVVLFSRDAESLGSTFTFSIREKGKYKILLTDVAPGTWQVVKKKDVVVPSASVRKEDGLLYFEGTEGDYTIKR